MSSTKNKFTMPSFINNLGCQLSTLYHTVQGEIMTTINGKLVDLNLIKPDEDELKTIYQPTREEEKETEIKLLQQSVNVLESRLHHVETHASYLEKMCNKLEKLEKQSSQKIMAISMIGTVGLTTLGIWGGLIYKSSLGTQNVVNYTEIEENYKR